MIPRKSARTAAAGRSGGASARSVNARQAPGMARASRPQRSASGPVRTGFQPARHVFPMGAISGRNCSRAVRAPAKRRAAAQNASVGPTTTPGARVCRSRQAPRRSIASAGDNGRTATTQGVRAAAVAACGGSAINGLEATGLPAAVGSQRKACTISAGWRVDLPGVSWRTAFRASPPAWPGSDWGRGAFGFRPRRDGGAPGAETGVSPQSRNRPPDRPA